MFTLQTLTGFVTLSQYTGTLEQDILYIHYFTAGFFAPEKSDKQS